jgi:hypothetical protein
MRMSRWRIPRQVALFAALAVAVAGLCAASGSAAGFGSAGSGSAVSGSVAGPAAGTRAAVADSQAAAEPPIDVTLYQDCDNPTDWLQPSAQFFPAAAYLGGWTDAAKLDGSLPVGYPEPALAASAGSGEGVQKSPARIGTNIYLCVRVLLQLDYHGLRELPPIRATFLAYGFEPVTATVQLVQPGPRDFKSCVEPDGTTSPACPPITAVAYADDTTTSPTYQQYQIVASAQLSLRISDVTVDGTPLNVGGSCAAGSVTTPGNPIGYDGAVLAGGDEQGEPEPQYASPLYGGAVDGSVYIGPVSGCGPGGDLDPLLTSAISGNGNYVKLIQSVLCEEETGLPTGSIAGSCEPNTDTPTVGPLWTVASGGAYAGPGSGAYDFDFGGGSEDVLCANSAVSGSIPDFAGPPRGPLGTFGWKFGGCAGSDGSTWTVAQQGTGVMDGQGPSEVISGTPGGVGLRADDVSLTFKGWGGQTGGTEKDPCEVVVSDQQASFTYTNPTRSSPAVLTAQSVSFTAGGFAMRMASSTCANIFTDEGMSSSTTSYPLRAGRAMTITSVPPPGA